MPNIKQQKKRVRTAAEERLENLRYSSTIKTLTKRLAAAVEEGDAATVETEHKGLVKLIDRAVTRGALHRNAAARKKSQAARLVAGLAPSLALALPRQRTGRGRAPRSRQHVLSAARTRASARSARGCVISTSARSSSRSGGRREPPFSAWSSSREPDGRAPELLRAEVPRLRVELLDVERVLLEPGGGVLGGEALAPRAPGRSGCARRGS